MIDGYQGNRQGHLPVAQLAVEVRYCIAAAMEAAMKAILVSAALLTVLTASASATPADAMSPEAQLDPSATGEGGNGAESVKLASLVASTFLLVPDSAQSLLVTVGEGGEGGRGRRLRRHRGYHFDYYRSYNYRLHRSYRPYYYPPRRYDRPYYDYRYEGPRRYF